MASFNAQDFGFEDPPPRPTTPPVRRGFLVVLFVLCAAAVAVYGSIYVTERISYAWEAGRARADAEVLAKLDQGAIVNRASLLFRMATNAVSPAVVKVQSLRLRRGGDGMPGLPIGGGNRLSPGWQSAELGSGVIIDKARGYIVTNNHVVRDADRIIVRLGPGDDVPADLVGADPKSDLAVIKIKADLTVEARWGDSEKLEIGEWVLAIGSPLGLDRSVTAGIVSATERNDVGSSEYQSYIQTDAAINPGNSGGPLINLAGKVVGINTAIISQSGGYEGIGLAIPSAMARRVVESLIKEGKVVRGYLGVMIQAIDMPQARKLGLSSNRGALITEVQPGSPADRAGLKANDVVVKLAGHEIADPSGLKNVTSGLDVGSDVTVHFYRAGEARTVQVTIVEMPPAPEVLATFGFGVRERRGAGDGQGPMIEIDQVITGGPAFLEKLRPDTRILAVGDNPPVPVRTLLEFEVAVRKIDVRRGLPLIVQSAGEAHPRAVRLWSNRFREQP
jgi:serine protease Do